ncbi:TonB-dependent receptor family protein [Alkalilimnicola sp. S0819]|uniref:TonB-dependent receptor family protein n=1 Tax=Alkalilimnicola sp. S0819 TaxID=2613922 RepID=UPI001262933A|nr:TonB-dependent receptor [Alkalilimnicola sp. S0819]KAB7624014.1 TonB-dependent receptor [Alkalilimnicola sp. S0819]MPQ16622.1 TonB-dependent receptor [Alkalilimnicola sp. S0819]
MSRHSSLTIAATLCLASGAAWAQDAGEPVKLDPLQIIGDPAAAQTLPGSGYVVGAEQLEREATTDINKALKAAPGIYVREEEGFGLRPNIGIRGATAERSSKITLLEDGVMIAPAPYSNPAAYYFPTMKRMSSVEVLKGAPLLRHGPQTTGGVVNLVSTPIPDESAGHLEAVVNERGGTDVHAHYGNTVGDWGFLLETVQRAAEGYKDIDRSNRDTGYDIQDYVGKLRWQGERQSVLLKLQHSEETSNASYLGLTDADFDDDPNRRYGLSSIDQMNNEHTGVNLTHQFQWTDRVSSTATLYHNEFERNWFKLSGGAAYVRDANNGDANAQGILDGTVDVAGLQYKNNARAYESQGLQLNFDVDLGAHQLAVGARYHEDEMDRFQPVETYDQVNGSLVFQGRTAPSGSNNRIETAEAVSFWVMDQWQATERLKLNLALRYEDVETARTQYGDPDRNTVDSTRSNDSDEWLPGVSFTYDVSDRWQLLGGVHRGFSPVGGGATQNVEPENSTNYEAGVRFFGERFFAEAIGFHSDFSDQTENCSLAAPCSNGSTSGSFVTGEADISGLELQFETGTQLGAFYLPVSLGYTYTRAEISKDNAASGLRSGDRLKDVPENQLALRVGLEHNSGWDNYAVVRYLDDMCTEAGCERRGSFNKTESLTVVDFISRYALTPRATVFLKVDNVFDEQRIVSRLPDGARPNLPRTAYVGLSVDF